LWQAALLEKVNGYLSLSTGVDMDSLKKLFVPLNERLHQAKEKTRLLLDKNSGLQEAIEVLCNQNDADGAVLLKNNAMTGKLSALSKEISARHSASYSLHNSIITESSEKRQQISTEFSFHVSSVSARLEAASARRKVLEAENNEIRLELDKVLQQFREEEMQENENEERERMAFFDTRLQQTPIALVEDLFDETKEKELSLELEERSEMAFSEFELRKLEFEKHERLLQEKLTAVLKELAVVQVSIQTDSDGFSSCKSETENMASKIRELDVDNKLCFSRIEKLKASLAERDRVDLPLLKELADVNESTKKLETLAVALDAKVKEARLLAN